jgi:hypothetical protein
MLRVVLDPLKPRVSCQTLIPKKNKKKSLSDLQTAGILVLKNARSIAENLGTASLFNPTAPNCGDKI